MTKKLTTLVIMDGYGVAPTSEHNAVTKAKNKRI